MSAPASTVASRREAGAEVRSMYQNFCLNNHDEGGGGGGAEGDGGDGGSARNAKAKAVVDGMLAKPKQVSAVLKVAREGMVSDKIKEHLTAIATSLVDDFNPALRKAVAEDPRIQKQFIRCKRQIEKAVLRDYKRELSQKRKDKLNLTRAAADLALSGLSTKAYAALRSVLCKAGLRNTLFSEKDLRKARKELMAKAGKDLETYATPDGWFISLRAAVETEILNLMQMTNVKCSLKEVACRSLDCNLRWEDHYHIKITLDARRITRRTSQTEVMLIILPKGQEGVDRCQKAVYHRTIGVWTGKDSRDNVQANMAKLYEEIQSLEQDGVLYSEEEGSLLGVWKSLAGLDQTEQEEARKKLRPVKVSFWHCGDMASQCAVLGHGCAGHKYCGHCSAEKENRHIPYELIRVEKNINFERLADAYDMFPSTLFAINAGLEGHDGPTEHGLRASTADAAFEEATAAVIEDEAEDEGGEAAARQLGADDGARRPAARRRGVRKRREQAAGKCKGPNVALMKGLTGWQSDHGGLGKDCACSKCVIPAGTVVRVIPRAGVENAPEWLKER